LSCRLDSIAARGLMMGDMCPLNRCHLLARTDYSGGSNALWDITGLAQLAMVGFANTV